MIVTICSFLLSPFTIFFVPGEFALGMISTLLEKHGIKLFLSNGFIYMKEEHLAGNLSMLLVFDKRVMKK